jgi:glutaredoxin
MRKLTLIKRSSPICPACNVMKAMLDGEGIEHDVVDITEDPGAVERFDITGVPALVFEGNGDDGGTIRMFGVQPIEQIQEALKDEGTAMNQ